MYLKKGLFPAGQKPSSLPFIRETKWLLPNCTLAGRETILGRFPALRLPDCLQFRLGIARLQAPSLPNPNTLNSNTKQRGQRMTSSRVKYVYLYIYMSTQPNVSITLVLHDVYYISAWLSQVPKKKASSSLCHHIVGAHNFDGHHRAIHLACTHMAQV